MDKIDINYPEKMKSIQLIQPMVLNDKLIKILEELETLERARGKVFEAEVCLSEAVGGSAQRFRNILCV